MVQIKSFSCNTFGFSCACSSVQPCSLIRMKLSLFVALFLAALSSAQANLFEYVKETVTKGGNGSICSSLGSLHSLFSNENLCPGTPIGTMT